MSHFLPYTNVTQLWYFLRSCFVRRRTALFYVSREGASFLVLAVLPSRIAQRTSAVFFEPFIDAMSVEHVTTLAYPARTFLCGCCVPDTIDTWHHVIVLADGTLLIRPITCDEALSVPSSDGPRSTRNARERTSGKGYRTKFPHGYRVPPLHPYPSLGRKAT